MKTDYIHIFLKSKNYNIKKNHILHAIWTEEGAQVAGATNIWNDQIDKSKNRNENAKVF